WSRLWPYSEDTAVWLVGKKTQQALFSDPEITNLIQFASPGAGSSAPRASLLGAPLLTLEHCQTLGTQGDIVLCDPQQYLLAKEDAMKTALSGDISGRFEAHESAFRFTLTVNGHSLWGSDTAALNGVDSSTSPFVN